MTCRLQVLPRGDDVPSAVITRRCRSAPVVGSHSLVTFTYGCPESSFPDHPPLYHLINIHAAVVIPPPSLSSDLPDCRDYDCDYSLRTLPLHPARALRVEIDLA